MYQLLFDVAKYLGTPIEYSVVPGATSAPGYTAAIFKPDYYIQLSMTVTHRGSVFMVLATDGVVSDEECVRAYTAKAIKSRANGFLQFIETRLGTLLENNTNLSYLRSMNLWKARKAEILATIATANSKVWPLETKKAATNSTKKRARKPKRK
jgi:hypothetical protein